MKVTRFTVDGKHVIQVEIPEETLVADDEVYLYFRKWAFEWEFLHQRKLWESRARQHQAALLTVDPILFPPQQENDDG